MMDLFAFSQSQSFDKICTACIMTADNLPRLGLESVDSFNCEHGEGFYFVWNTLSRISPFNSRSHNLFDRKQSFLVMVAIERIVIDLFAYHHTAKQHSTCFA